MDEEARRNMWSVIEKVLQSRSVVLLHHSMEEVEALCTRMGVMVSGRLQCLGTAQHLKDRFGGGYQVELRCQPLRVSDCLQLCLQVFPNASISEQYGGYFRLDTSRNIDLSEAFGTLERSKDSHGIYDYSISQCTLEQIFIQFAKEQEEERPPETAAITASDTTSESQVAPKAIITIESTTQQI